MPKNITKTQFVLLFARNISIVLIHKFLDVCDRYEPPSIGLVLHDAVDRGLLAKPQRFVERGQLPRKRGMGAVTFWHPLPPPGYEALGCIASTGSSPDPDNLIRCVRSDLVIGSNFSASTLWDTADIKHKDEGLSIWPVENQVQGRRFEARLGQCLSIRLVTRCQNLQIVIFEGMPHQELN